MPVGRIPAVKAYQARVAWKPCGQSKAIEEKEKLCSAELRDFECPALAITLREQVMRLKTKICLSIVEGTGGFK